MDSTNDLIVVSRPSNDPKNPPRHCVVRVKRGKPWIGNIEVDGIIVAQANTYTEAAQIVLNLQNKNK